MNDKELDIKQLILFTLLADLILIIFDFPKLSIDTMGPLIIYFFMFYCFFIVGNLVIMIILIEKYFENKNKVENILRRISIYHFLLSIYLILEKVILILEKLVLVIYLILKFLFLVVYNILIKPIIDAWANVRHKCDFSDGSLYCNCGNHNKNTKGETI